uniref:Uncharacterized protein n=1 Tax=Klebsiella pneumoniae TaxID=573 RepID=A0A8B0SU14_KLEPN|nr:hypothetical protein [Klebsiella pneumoniae]
MSPSTQAIRTSFSPPVFAGQSHRQSELGRGRDRNRSRGYDGLSR